MGERRYGIGDSPEFEPVTRLNEAEIARRVLGLLTVDREQAAALLNMHQQKIGKDAFCHHPGTAYRKIRFPDPGNQQWVTFSLSHVRSQSRLARRENRSASLLACQSQTETRSATGIRVYGRACR